MKKLFLFVLVASTVCGIINGQKSSLSIKSGITNCITKTMLVPHIGSAVSGFEPRVGGLLGGRYDFKLSKRFRTGAELLYLLKGNTSNPDAVTIYSNHYISLSPYLSVFPFVNSKNKFISCISPELGFDFNHFIGTNKTWKPFKEVKFYQYELGYTFRLTYQPEKLGIQFFYFSSLTPFYVTHSLYPFLDDYKYSFVSGVSVLYKIVTLHRKS